MFSATHTIYGGKNKLVVVVIADSGTSQQALWLLGKLLASYGYKSIVMTWKNPFAADDPKQFVENCKLASRYVADIIASLPKRQQKHLCVFGISQGSIIASIIAKQIPSVEKIILNLIGKSPLKTPKIWSNTYPTYKDGVPAHFSIKQIKRLATYLDPLTNIAGSNVKSALLYLAEKDEAIPYILQEELLKGLRKEKIKTKAVINTKHSHQISLIINLLRFKEYITFLNTK